MLHPPPDNKRDTTAAGDAEVTGQALHALVLSLSHGLESLRRQLHEQHAAGEVLRADLAAQTDACRTALERTQTSCIENQELLSTLAALKAEVPEQRESVAELQARVGALETLAERLQALVEPVSQPSPEPPASPARPTVVMPPMRLNANAANLWDRLPDDVRSKIVDLAGDLTKLANGLLHPLEVKMMHQQRIALLWIDAMACDWQGDLRSLPEPPPGQFEHAIRTRSMFERVQKLGIDNHGLFDYIAFANRWGEPETWTEEFPRAKVAAMCGKIDVLRDMYDGRQRIQLDQNAFAWALAAAQFGAFAWLVKFSRRKYPKDAIPAHLRDPSIHRLLMTPLPNLLYYTLRLNALVLCNDTITSHLPQYVELADPVCLEILYRRFCTKVDFSSLHLQFHSVEMLEWAHSRGLTRDKDKVAESIAYHAKTAAVAQWACKNLGVVFEQQHFLIACSVNSPSLVSWLLTLPGIEINQTNISSAAANMAIDSISALIAHDRSVADQIIVAASWLERNHLETMRRASQSKTPVRDFLEWLDSRHSLALSPAVLAHTLVSYSADMINGACPETLRFFHGKFGSDSGSQRFFRDYLMKGGIPPELRSYFVEV